MSYENIVQDGLKTTALEMFSLALSQNCRHEIFPVITTLILLGQCIQKISDLGYCLFLKELWDAECCVVEVIKENFFLANFIQFPVPYNDNRFFTNIPFVYSRKESWSGTPLLKYTKNPNLDIDQIAFDTYYRFL